MKHISPSEKHHALRPKIGDRIETTPTATNPQWEWCGNVERVEGPFCHYRYRAPKENETNMFIWVFEEGLNTLHRWMPQVHSCSKCGRELFRNNQTDGWLACSHCDEVDEKTTHEAFPPRDLSAITHRI